MTVASSTALTAVRNPSVVFKGGQSALGHHWRLLDCDGEEVGRTKLYYDDFGGKTVGRLMRATGLSQRGDINARSGTRPAKLLFASSRRVAHQRDGWT